VLSPDSYLPQSKPTLLVRLVEVTTSLGELYTQRHTATIELTKARHDSYNHHSQESEAAKKRIMEQETYYLQEVVDDMDTQILIALEEISMLKFLIGNLDG